jgi:tetratricopeptide (TPR) repeat protein
VDLARDDRDGYRRHCARALERFGQATEPETAVTVPWLCKLAPDAVADYAAAVRCAERAVAANPKNVEYLNHLGGILLRAGRPEEAVQRLEEAQKLRRDGSGVWEWIWLALAHQHLGHAAEARQWLDRAGRWIDEFAPEGPGADERLTWDARLELRLLRREAEAALK